MHGGHSCHGLTFCVVPHRCWGFISTLGADDVSQVLLERVLSTILTASSICIVVGESALIGRAAGVVYQCILQLFNGRVSVLEKIGYRFGHHYNAVSELLTTAQCKLAAFRDVPCHELHYTFWVDGGWCHIVAPH